MACDDGNPCTDDACDPVSGCKSTNNAAACNDGDACTAGDICGGGKCAGATPVKCDDGNPSTSGDACKLGYCVGSSIVVDAPADVAGEKGIDARGGDEAQREPREQHEQHEVQREPDQQLGRERKTRVHAASGRINK